MRPEHRRELRHDKFVDEMGSLSTRARENQRFLLTITIAVVAAAVVAYGIYYYRNTREQKAQETFDRTLADSHRVFTGPDIEEGIEAFFAKRAPVFTAGRNRTKTTEGD